MALALALSFFNLNSVYSTCRSALCLPPSLSQPDCLDRLSVCLSACPSAYLLTHRSICLLSFPSIFLLFYLRHFYFSLRLHTNFISNPLFLSSLFVICIYQFVCLSGLSVIPAHRLVCSLSIHVSHRQYTPVISIHLPHIMLCCRTPPLGICVWLQLSFISIGDVNVFSGNVCHRCSKGPKGFKKQGQIIYRKVT